MYECLDCKKIFQYPTIEFNGKDGCPYCLSMNFCQYEPHVISGFPGIGKSYFCKISKKKAIDSDSSKYSHLVNGDKNPSFPYNYVTHIQDNLFKQDNIILVSSHMEIRKAMRENGIPYILCYPDISCKEEYMERYRKRGNDDKFLSLMDNNWEKFINDMKNDPCTKRIVLKEGEYLSHYI